jgi:hypothetical protein
MKTSLSSTKTNLFYDLTLEDLPTKCPHCHKSMVPMALFGFHTDSGSRKFPLEVFMNCPAADCKQSFIAYYHRLNEKRYYYGDQTSIGSFSKPEFSETINNISEDFILIFSEAHIAEELNLLEICGVGYRKAIEFLIKDYLIRKNPKNEEKIKKEQLGPCINKFIENEKIKMVSKRAVWLGNDETHYVRKWENKDLKDLKSLISLVIYWIEMEVLSSNLEHDMPDNH